MHRHSVTAILYAYLVCNIPNSFPSSNYSNPIYNVFFVVSLYQFSFLEPWVHVGLAGVFGYGGYNLTRWEEEWLVKVNEKRVQKGLVPITRKQLNPISSMISNEE